MTSWDVLAGHHALCRRKGCLQCFGKRTGRSTGIESCPLRSTQMAQNPTTAMQMGVVPEDWAGRKQNPMIHRFPVKFGGIPHVQFRDIQVERTLPLTLWKGWLAWKMQGWWHFQHQNNPKHHPSAPYLCVTCGRSLSSLERAWNIIHTILFVCIKTCKPKRPWCSVIFC